MGAAGHREGCDEDRVPVRRVRSLRSVSAATGLTTPWWLDDPQIRDRYRTDLVPFEAPAGPRSDRSSFALGWIINKTIGFRITRAAEAEGIDITEHSETAYEFDTQSSGGTIPSGQLTGSHRESDGIQA